MILLLTFIQICIAIYWAGDYSRNNHFFNEYIVKFEKKYFELETISFIGSDSEKQVITKIASIFISSIFVIILSLMSKKYGAPANQATPFLFWLTILFSMNSAAFYCKENFKGFASYFFHFIPFGLIFIATIDELVPYLQEIRLINVDEQVKDLSMLLVIVVYVSTMYLLSGVFMRLSKVFLYPAVSLLQGIRRISPKNSAFTFTVIVFIGISLLQFIRP